LAEQDDRAGNAAPGGGQTPVTGPGAHRAALPLDDLYREVVLDHYRKPRGRSPLSHPSCSVEGFNPTCGDQVHLALDVADDTVREAQVQCQGCSISVASGSMMAELVTGRDVPEVRRLIEAVKGMMQGKDPDPSVDLGDLEALEGVKKFPVRVKCALLAWTTLEEALAGLETAGK
jgi:nitrogen fixation NifU-like protein